MERIDGETLGEFLKRIKGKYLNEQFIIQIFYQLVSAVKHCHDNKVIHRDLKPDNIFITNNYQIKLGDFGVSRTLESSLQLASTHAGTPIYMSPEILLSKKYSYPTDVWSLGCILYELITFQQPFPPASMFTLVNAIVTQDPPPIHLNYSSKLKTLVTLLLVKEPEFRISLDKILESSLFADFR